MSAYLTAIRQIVDGMTIDANNANTPLAQLQGNINYVRELVESALRGSTIIARDRTADAAVQVGQPVYFNTANQQFEKALPRVQSVAGELTPAESTYVVGIVLQKTTATKIDVLLRGLAPVDMSAAVDGTVTSGLYYLSTQTAGKLTKVQPAVSVPVCLVLGPSGDSEHEILVNTDFRDILNAHRHYRFDLVCAEAATSDDEGWLPADDAVFGSNAPANAVYGYNLSVSAIGNVWPPVPLESAYLEWHKTSGPEVMGQGVPVGTESPALVQFDENGIWWLSDCTGDEPWPDSEYEPSGSCPRAPEMRMVLYFNRPIFWTANTAVLSLTPKANSGLTITCRGTPDAATSGHLEIDLDLGLATGATNVAGHSVVKSITNQQFNYGPVVEAVKSGSSNVTITSSLGALPPSGNAQGIVTIAVDDSRVGTELPVETVHLDGVTEEFYKGVIALGFGYASSQAYTGRICIPDVVADNSTIKLRFTLLGRAAGSIGDAFELSYVKIDQASSTPAVLSVSSTVDPGFDTTKTLAAPDSYYRVESSEITVNGGDVLLFTLERTDLSYTAQIQVIDQRGVFV